MTHKFQALVTAWIAGLSAFIAWLMTVPPEQQTALLGPLVEVMPLTWRPAVGLATRLLATGSTIFAVYRAAQSGPSPQPPASVTDSIASKKLANEPDH